jgi:hypothetical protein
VWPADSLPSIKDLNRRRLNDSTNELDAALVVYDHRA